MDRRHGWSGAGRRSRSAQGGYPGTATRAEQHGVGLEGHRSVRRCRPPRCGRRPGGRYPGSRPPAGCGGSSRWCCSRCSTMEVIRWRSTFEVERTARTDDAHAGDPPEIGHGPARGDHGLGRDAVPQIGGTSDHVPFDEGDVHTEAGGVGGSLVAGRTAADDDESHGVRLCRYGSVRVGTGVGGGSGPEEDRRSCRRHGGFGRRYHPGRASQGPAPCHRGVTVRETGRFSSRTGVPGHRAEAPRGP